MIFSDFKFFSEALGMQVTCYVLLPQRGTVGQIGVDSKVNEGKFKCVYLLHGCSDDHSIWMRRTSVERYVEAYGVAVVMPFAARSFYMDNDGSYNYYTYIAKELPARICDTFNISPKREDNFVAGLSMGGYGALKIALRENDSFAAGAGFSSVTDMLMHSTNHDWALLFGDGIKDEDNLFALAEKTAKAKNKPRLYISCGTEDGLYPENDIFMKKIVELGYDNKCVRRPGVHSWDFWDVEIQEALKFFFD